MYRWFVQPTRCRRVGTGALFDAFLPALENWTPAAPPPEYEDEDWDEYVEEDEGEWYQRRPYELEDE